MVIGISPRYDIVFGLLKLIPQFGYHTPRLNIVTCHVYSLGFEMSLFAANSILSILCYGKAEE